jgi:2-phospho-L-lactate guanylyltransferase
MVERKIYSTHAIVPLHVPKLSKARLSKVFNKEERATLTLAMLDHVLLTLHRAHTISSVSVVSADRNVRRKVERRGARFIWEGQKCGLNSAITLAQRRLKIEDNSSVLIIHADLPTLSPREVDSFVRAARHYEIGIAPSKDGTGTNALFLEAPNLISTAFGRKSFHKHLRLIHKKSLRHKIIRLRGIGFDLDDANDLQKLIRSPARNDVSQFVRKLDQNTHKSSL